MKKTIFITYFSFVTLTLISVVFSVFYIHILHYKVYEQYVPEITVDFDFNPTAEFTYCDVKVGEKHYNIKVNTIKKYDALSGKTVHKIKLRYASEYVSWYGMALYRIYYFNLCYASYFYFFAFLTYFPMLLYYKKNIATAYWIIVAFEIVVSCVISYL
jgi:hypothetical protein